MNTELGELIKQKRIEKGLSQTELANKMGVNVSTISRWESGEIENMRRHHVALISEVLDISIYTLMGWDVPDDYPSIMKKIGPYLGQMNNESQKRFMEYAEFLISRQEEKDVG